MQEADDEPTEGALIASPERFPARLNGGQPHGTPPATPQQLRAAVEALTDQLDSAKKSLMTCVGSPAARRQRDASLARCAAPAQVLLARQRLGAHNPIQELPDYRQGATTAPAAPVTLLAAAVDATQDTIEASSKQHKHVMSAADTTEHIRPEADVSKALAAAPADEPPAMPDLSAAMTLLQIGRGISSGCGSEAVAEEYAACHAEPTAATAGTAMPPRSDEAGLNVRETQQPSRLEMPAPPQMLAQAVESGHVAVGEKVGKGILAPGISGIPEQHADPAAAHCPAETGGEGGSAPEGGLTDPDGGSTAAAGAGEAAACLVQNTQRTVGASTLPERDISPDFGEDAKEGERVQGRVMDTVGKLCRDIDPMQGHDSNREQTQAAEVAKADPQAAAELAEAASNAKAGTRICEMEVVQRPVEGAEAQRIEDSAHTSGADLGPNAHKEGSKAAEPEGADERSSGSAGSWKTCPETAEGLHPEKSTEMPLTATAAPGKELSADDPKIGVVAATSRSANPATSATLGSGQHTSSRKSARAPSRVPSRSARVQAEQSSGRKPSRMAQASPSQAQPGQPAAKSASSKLPSSACTISEGGSESNIGSPAAAQTNVNTPLTSGCIFGCACSFKPSFSLRTQLKGSVARLHLCAQECMVAGVTPKNAFLPQP